MGTTRDSSFKVKAGVINGTRANIVPEAGAILFDISSRTFIAGDGFTWNEMGAAAVAKSKLATTLETAAVTAVVAGVEKQAPIYDTIVYNLEAGMTPATGNQITFNKDMTVDFSALFGIACSTPQVTVDLITYLDATPISTLSYLTGQAGEVLQVIALGSIPVLDTQVLTLNILVNKSCNLTTFPANMGLAEI